jgi:SpoVK/Ycf46/Vps4 family AAA+-type ATPase
MNVVRFARRRGKNMEMINGEKKLHVWLYKYEQDGVSPVFEVDGSRQEVEYTINNSVDSLYTFCKLEFADDSSEECEVADIYTLEVPGDAENPQMNLRVFTAENSPFIDVLVTNDQKEKIVEQNYLIGGLETVEVVHDEEQNVVSETLAELDKMPGMSQIKEKMKDIIECAQLQKLREEQGLPKVEISRHLVLQGPPGSGKTTVARLLGQIYYDLGITKNPQIIEVDRGDLVGSVIGETALKTKKAVEAARGGILFIDEAYTLSKGDGNDFGQEAIDTLLKCMEDHKDDLIVIVAGYTELMSKFINSNPGLKSRFKTCIDFKDYTAEELYQIFLLLCQKHGMTIETTALEDLKKHFEKMAKNKGLNFGNGREVRNYFENTVIAHQAHRIAMMKEPSKEELSCIKYSDFNFDQQDVRTEITEALNELSQMVGLKRVKEEVNTLLSLAQNRKQREENGYAAEAINMHMAFLGNPGNGKTTVARIMAKLLYNMGFIGEDKIVEVSSPDLIAGYTGQTALKTRDVIINAMGGVLFIDEAYALNSTAGGFGDEAIAVLLKYMEDYHENLVVIVAGYEDEMEKFLNSNSGLRSRFPNVIHFEDYTADELLQIFELLCHKKQYAMTSEAKQLLHSFIKSHKSEFRGNGRDVRNLFEKVQKKQAFRLAKEEKCTAKMLMEIVKEDIQEAISDYEKNN